jgi:hypothetical protein
MKNRLLIIILLWAVLMPGCECTDDPPSSVREGALPDVNATSPTFGQYILPEDFEGQVSAWYFGHST